MKKVSENTTKTVTIELTENELENIKLSLLYTSIDFGHASLDKFKEGNYDESDACDLLVEEYSTAYRELCEIKKSCNF